MAVLEIKAVSKSFKKQEILKEVSFICRTGEITGIFGRNGTGKSTLLKIIFGVLSPDHLEMSIDGEVISNRQVIPKRLIGYLPQNSFLPGDLKVRKAISIYFHEEEKLDAIFYAPKIAKIEEKRVGALSVGERRYLEVLLIGFSDHPFLMFDEPFSMIEPLHKNLIKEFFITIKKDKGLIISDHYYDDVLQVTDKNFLINEGNCVFVSDRNELNKHGYLPTQ